MLLLTLGAKQEIWDLLLKFYASLDSRDDNGSSAIIIAAQEDHTETLEILANLGANIYATDNCGCTALHQATLRNQVQVIKFLVEGLKINVDYQSSNGSSALLFSAHENHPELIEMLITELGANKDLIDIEGQPAVMRASYRGNEASLRTLVRLNADMKSANNDGYGALHLASCRGHDHIVNLIVGTFDEDADVCTEDGASALIVAILNKHSSTARLLIQLGADVEIDLEGISPYAAAIAQGLDELANYIEHMRGPAHQFRMRALEGRSRAIIKAITMYRYQTGLCLSTSDVPVMQWARSLYYSSSSRKKSVFRWALQGVSDSTRLYFVLRSTSNQQTSMTLALITHDGVQHIRKQIESYLVDVDRHILEYQNEIYRWHKNHLRKK